MTEIPDAISDVVGGLAIISIQPLIDKLPAEYKEAAGNFLAEYSPAFFEMTVAQIWGYIRRMNEGDFKVIPEILSKLSDDDFLTKVAANSAVWEGVAAAEVAKSEFQKQLVLKLIPIVGAILAALVGL